MIVMYIVHGVMTLQLASLKMLLHTHYTTSTSKYFQYIHASMVHVYRTYTCRCIYIERERNTEVRQWYRRLSARLLHCLNKGHTTYFEKYEALTHKVLKSFPEYPAVGTCRICNHEQFLIPIDWCCSRIYMTL